MMKHTAHNHLEDTHGLLSFDGKAVVSTDNGRKIGSVEDILIDPHGMSIAAILTSKGGFLRTGVKAIKAEEISLWGEDVILVNRSDAARNKSEITGMEDYLSAFDNIPDRDVISMEGDRLGKMEDLLITPNGHLAGFSLSRVGNGLAELLKHEKKDKYQLPISTLHSFGKDVLIIDLDRVRDVFPQTAPVETASERPIETSEFVPATGNKEEVDDRPQDL